MSRYEGRQNAKAVERDYPHFVDIAVPLGMHDFHARYQTAARSWVGTTPMVVSFVGALLTRLSLPPSPRNLKIKCESGADGVSKLPLASLAP